MFTLAAVYYWMLFLSLLYLVRCALGWGHCCDEIFGLEAHRGIGIECVGMSVWAHACGYFYVCACMCIYYIFYCDVHLQNLPAECSPQLPYNLEAISFAFPLINLSLCFVINLHLLRNRYRSRMLSVQVISSLTLQCLMFVWRWINCETTTASVAR